MALTPSQANRPLTATTPLGTDVLIPVSMRGEEGVSQTFLFTVDFISTNTSVAPASILGKPVTLQLALADGSVRPIHGLVRRFSSGGVHGKIARYQAEIVPSFWFLTLSSDCRTFENMAPLDIIEQVCKDAGVTDLKRRVTTPPPVLQYVVQYQETNFAFVCRLLEDAGLYYTFDHAPGVHTLVFSDSLAGSVTAGLVATAKIDSQTVAAGRQPDTVFEFRREYSVHSASVSLRDHDPFRAASVGSAASSSPGVRGESFAFLGDLGPNDSAAEAELRIEAQEAERDLVHGASNCAAFQSGTRVKFTDGPLGAGAEFHLLRVTHSMEIGDLVSGTSLTGTYENRFVAMPVATQFRPPQTTPRALVRGTQTATVVGSGNAGDIEVDANSRIHLQFPWDRGAGKDGKSTNWVNVVSRWAGTTWGFIQIPRIGQDVLVEFLEGDPARPIVTGGVWDSSHAPPYPLPGDKAKSGWRSRSLGGGSGFNELYFDDTSGKEMVSEHAEKDLSTVVKNDETRAVGHDRTTTIDNDETRTVTKGNDSHTVSKGNQTVLVSEGDQTFTVSKGNQTVTVSEGDQTVTVSKGKQTVTVYDDQTITVEQGKRSVTVKQGDDLLSVKLGNLTVDVGAGNIGIKAGAGKIAIEAMQGIQLKVGQNTIDVSPTGITIKGLNVSAEATVQADLKGVTTTVQGTATAAVKGPVVQVTADGVLTLKGGITMIN